MSLLQRGIPAKGLVLQGEVMVYLEYRTINSTINYPTYHRYKHHHNYKRFQIKIGLLSFYLYLNTNRDPKSNTTLDYST